eukprot:2896552-Prymnesium_polylepis.1
MIGTTPSACAARSTLRRASTPVGPLPGCPWCTTVMRRASPSHKGTKTITSSAASFAVAAA